MDSDEPMYQFRRSAARRCPAGRPPNTLDVSGANGLAQAAGVACFWIRSGVVDRVEVLHRQRLVLAISRFDVRVLDEPRGQDTYQVRTLDREHALISSATPPTCETHWWSPTSSCCPEARPLWWRCAEGAPSSPS